MMNERGPILAGWLTNRLKLGCFNGHHRLPILGGEVLDEALLTHLGPLEMKNCYALYRFCKLQPR